MFYYTTFNKSKHFMQMQGEKMKVIGTQSHNLYRIHKHFDEGRWHLPDHQRILVWDKKKIKDWFKDIIQLHKEGGGEMPGCIIIYKGPNDPSKTYLNDGAQRAYWTILKFIDYCKQKDLDWKEILTDVNITVQEVEYKNIDEAIRNFIRINYGTAATPYELTRTMFCSRIADFKDYWEPRLAKVHQAVETGLNSLGCKTEDRDEANQRELAHKRMRDEHHMFWKFLSGDQSQFSPQVSIGTLKSDSWKKQTKLEEGLLEELMELGHANLEDAIAAFERFVDFNIALYKQIWEQTMPAADRPGNVHIRWWLIVSIYCKNNNISTDSLREFTERFIKYTEGRTTIFYDNPNGKQCNTNTSMSKLQQLGMVSKIIEATLIPKDARKATSNRMLKKGFVKSHVNSFSAHGNGQVIAENAIENANRSARDMTKEEIKRCEPINVCKSKLQS
jgi:hypothetical protein